MNPGPELIRRRIVSLLFAKRTDRLLAVLRDSVAATCHNLVLLGFLSFDAGQRCQSLKQRTLFAPESIECAWRQFRISRDWKTESDPSGLYDCLLGETGVSMPHIAGWSVEEEMTAAKTPTRDFQPI